MHRPQRLLGLLTALACGACGADDTAPVGRHDLRPGESLLDHLDRAEVVQWSATNLPATVIPFLKGGCPVRTSDFQEQDWTPWGSWEAQAILKAYEGKVWAWRVVPALSRVPGSPVRILQHGAPVPAVDLEQSPYPEEMLFWDEDAGEVRAVGHHWPEGVSLEYQADPLRLFDATEPRLARHLTDPDAAWPAAQELSGRVIQENVSRRTLAAPAPSRVTFDLGEVHGDALRVAFAVQDGGYEVVEGALRQASGQGDGVTFAVEVTEDGGTQRVFERHVPRAEVGAGWQVASVDLSAFPRADLQLHLVTEPGPDGNRDFDHGVWADLRLQGSPAGPPERPHVILVDIDTLRADRLSCQGHDLPTTPRLDEWARRHAVRYAEARSTAGWTLPSTASILTGLSVHQHGVDVFPERMEAEHRPLAQLLGEAGYETMGLAEGIYVKPEFGFDLGFDTYDCTRHNNPDWSAALDWIGERRSEQPFFLMLHTYLVHAPWPFAERLGDCRPDLAGDLVGQKVGYAETINPFRRGQLDLSEDERTYISRMYDERVHLMDRRVGPFLERLDQALEGQPYLLIFLSDHGDEFFEHGGVDHGHSLYQELLEVPLLVRYPEDHVSAPPAGSVVDTKVTTLDLVPTILDVVGLPLPDDRHLPGRSLLTLEAEAERPLVAHMGPLVRSLEFQGWKLIENHTAPAQEAGMVHQLFHLTEDPGEQVDLSREQGQIVKRMIRLLDEYVEAHAPVHAAAEAVVDPELLQALRAQGYLVGDDDS